jgi:hypothetical protein
MKQKAQSAKGIKSSRYEQWRKRVEICDVERKRKYFEEKKVDGSCESGKWVRLTPRHGRLMTD